MKKFRKEHKKQGFWSSLWGIVVAIFVALCLRTFLAEPFSIPSGSMIPTMLIGDYLYVAKYGYGYSRYSFPFGPDLFEGRIMNNPPKRGDVAVFMGARDPWERYIKRVIGLPGDVVEIKNGYVHINGESCPQKRIEDYVEKKASGRIKRTAQFVETLPNGVDHLILREDVETGGRPEDNMGPYHVPAGHYFMMGDNRNHSGDSRMSMGYIPLENFVGPAKFIFFSIDSSILDIWKIWEWPEIIRTKRIFSSIK